LLALDDQPTYSGSDHDYNDVAFLIERTNGGEAVSQLMSSDIPSSQLANTVISRVRVQVAATFPSPGCDGVAAAVNIYYSVDGKKTWRQVSLPSKTGGDVTIDVLGTGDVGNQLYWKVDFVSPTQTCSPILSSFAIGYEAVEQGEFKFAAPVPVANVVYSGSLETPPFPTTEPAATAGDYSVRGHFRATRLYDPANPSVTALSTLWDAGARVSLSTASPGSRNVYTSIAGVGRALSTANSTTLYPLVLPSSLRTQKYGGRPIYDFNGDGVADDTDARFIVEWTRGWEFPSGITFAPSQTVTQRAWRLGPVHSSSPAIAGPPPRPTWIDGSGAPAALVAAHNTFRTANAQRLTRAVVGSQDGMIHAFDAGQFRWGSDPACTVQLQRGCFAGTTDAARYGSGDEIWTYVPPSQLANLPNNHPAVRAAAQTIGGTAAEVNGSISVEDVWMPSTSSFKTTAFATLGRNQPYVTAIDVTTDTPGPLWAADFSDANFHGSELSPSVGLATLGGSVRSTVVFTSGLGTAAADEYLYLLDGPTGAVQAKAKLNTTTSPAQGTGFAGYPNLVDADNNGLVDRVYTVDTTGRVFKYDLQSGTSCVVASLGESVYTGMAVQLQAVGSAPAVKLFIGGGPNPDGSGTVAAAYHLFAILDNDRVGTCSGTSQPVYTVTLASGQKVWAAPYVGTDQVYFATASSTALSVCQSGAGAVYSLGTSGDGTGAPVGGVPTATGITGSPVSGIRVFDGHVLVNSVGGQTTILGSQQWNNLPAGGSGTNGAILTLPELSWEQL
jgi:type IV pilus assembly protein PilY1